MDITELEDEIETSVWAETSENTYGAAHPPVGRKLPLGVYEVGMTMSGESRFIKRATRNEPLLRFPGSIDKILEEIQFFWTRRSVYETLNLPYRRGILIYGPPGTGKTSLIKLALDDVVARGGIGLMFGNIHHFKEGFEVFRKIEPDTPVVVVIEDLENHCQNNFGGHYESEFLNFLDGHVDGVENVVFIATSNYIESIPDRMKNRPSRFDRKIEIGYPCAEHRKTYLKSLLKSVPGALDTYQSRLLDRDPVADTEGMSLAHLKELFIAVTVLGADYDETLKGLQETIGSNIDDSGPE